MIIMEEKMLLMAIIKVYDIYKPISVSTNLDLRSGKERRPRFKVFDSFTGCFALFSVERRIERTPGKKTASKSNPRTKNFPEAITWVVTCGVALLFYIVFTIRM